MSFLSLEGLRIFGFESPEDDAIAEYVDYGLECSNAKRAECLAVRIREEIGIYRFGPMWADWFGELPDGREVWLQASEKALIITITSTDDSRRQDIHTGWDRTHLNVYSLDVRSPDKDRPQMSYQKNLTPQYSPASLTPWHISRQFADTLGFVEKAAECTDRGNVNPWLLVGSQINRTGG